MKLIQIYECLCDQTRLRILHLLLRTPLCVSQMQKGLQLTQVKVSKHLTYMKERGLVIATRFDNRMVYRIAEEMCPELDNNLKCLQDCCQEYSIFQEDLKRLEKILEEVNL